MLRLLLKWTARRLKPYLIDDYSNIRFSDGKTVSEKQSWIGEGCLLTNPDRITFGTGVSLGNNSIIKPLLQFESASGRQQFSPRIEIGNNVQVTAELQIHCLKEIIIEDNVLLAKNVFLADGFHGYNDVRIPFKDQELINILPIKICKGSWLGQNVVVMPGVTIGQFSIIGANSVVTRSIPPYSIAVGAPAEVIKKWSFEQDQWLKI